MIRRFSRWRSGPTMAVFADVVSKKKKKKLRPCISLHELLHFFPGYKIGMSGAPHCGNNWEGGGGQGTPPLSPSAMDPTQVSGHGTHHDSQELSRGRDTQWTNPGAPAAQSSGSGTQPATAGALRSPVEMSGCTGDGAPRVIEGTPAAQFLRFVRKGKEPLTKPGWEEPGRRRGHGAAQTTLATTEACTTPASTTKERTPPAQMHPGKP